MADKILTEAFDKLKAIEESDDPFCIGAEADEVVETYTEVKEESNTMYEINWDNDQVELMAYPAGHVVATMDIEDWERLVKEYTDGQRRRQGQRY